MADRDILLAISDVWRAENSRPFVQGGARCARLVKARRADTPPEDAIKIPVDQMRAAEARTLIGAGLPEGQEAACYRSPDAWASGFCSQNIANGKGDGRSLYVRFT